MNELNLLIEIAMGLNLVALGTGRIPSLIRTVALQGIVLGIIPLLLEDDMSVLFILVSIATFGIKGILIPGLLNRAMRSTQMDRDLDPLIGYVPGLLLGAAGMIASVLFAHRLPLLPSHQGSLLVAGSLSMVFTGFLLLVGRSKALSQVCGYLILENGVYMFGLLLINSSSLFVEGGILLDLTVAVFIIGIVMDRIQQAFDTLDTRQLNTLHE